MIAIKEKANPENWMNEHGSALLQFAKSRLRDNAAAEDAVQDALLAAYKSRSRFMGQSRERTWLIGILKHKIVDHIRKQSRTIVLEDVSLVQEERMDTYDRKGHWRVAPSEWTVNPRMAFEQKEFSDVLADCLAELDERHRKVFVMRELEQRSIEEISQELEVTPNNLSVILHRAKARLKTLVHERWAHAPDRNAA